MDEHVFFHKCVEDDCEIIVTYDDEPWCFKHSPDSGSSLRGYSAREEALILPANLVIKMLVKEIERTTQEFVQLQFSEYTDIRVTALLNLAKEWLEHNPIKYQV